MAIGAVIAPIASASRVSRGGSDASRVTASASIAREPSTPPVIFTIL